MMMQCISFSRIWGKKKEYIILKCICFLKDHIFREGHKILQNLHLTFVLCKGEIKLKTDRHARRSVDSPKKTNEWRLTLLHNYSYSKKTKAVRSFFGTLFGLTICF